MFHATLENFQTQVIAASNVRPVLLDLGSPRSHASQALTTALTQLEAEYGGAFTLACANCDLVPQLAQAFQVQQVPTCLLLDQGQPVDGFAGSLNTAQVRDFLNKHLQAIVPEPAQYQLLALAKSSAAAQDVPAAIANAKAAIDANPHFADARLLLAALLMDTQPQLAQAQCDAINADSLSTEHAEQYALLKTELAQRIAAAQAALESPEITALKAAVQSNGKDLPARLALAHAYQAQRAYELALTQLFAIVQTDRAFQEDIGRKTMIEVFALASDTPDVVRAWRHKLSAALN
jgi:putative thioredoxin